MPLDGTLYEPKDEILRVLKIAQERIRDPEDWCQEALYHENKVCARGALLVALGAPTYSAWLKACEYPLDRYERELDNAAREQGYRELVHLNNTSNHSKVMKMFDRAIELHLAKTMVLQEAT